MAVRLTIDAETLDAPPGATLFACAQHIGVRVPSSCPQGGRCKECLVEVVEGMDRLSERDPDETHLDGGFRLACRARIVATEGAVRCETPRRGEMVIETAGAMPAGALRRDGEPYPDPAAPRDDGEPIRGVAIDIGTTTIVARLVDLDSGCVLETRSFENPQRFGGSDVMARIRYDTEHPGQLLQRALLGYLGQSIHAFNGDAESIREIVVVGNSTMRDLFFGLDVHSIGQRPYRSLTELACETGDRETTALAAHPTYLGLPGAMQSRVVSLPLVSGHVGADTTACLLTIDLAREERLVALMDIGTNTELVVGNRHRVLAASCPAGPAFEGGAISRGMPGLPGAVEDVTIAADGNVAARVIGDGEPIGICGSGLIKCMGELARTGRIDEFGRLTDESDRFVIDAAHDIAVSEADLSELAQAKGANVAGLRIVLDRYGATLDDIEVFYLAGGFARHIDLDAARRVGLIPDLPDEKFIKLGNAAIEGATLALCSMSRRREMEALVREIEHVELETDARFFDWFVEGCLFRPTRDADSGAAEADAR